MVTTVAQDPGDVELPRCRTNHLTVEVPHDASKACHVNILHWISLGTHGAVHVEGHPLGGFGFKTFIATGVRVGNQRWWAHALLGLSDACPGHDPRLPANAQRRRPQLNAGGGGGDAGVVLLVLPPAPLCLVPFPFCGSWQVAQKSAQQSWKFLQPMLHWQVRPTANLPQPKWAQLSADGGGADVAGAAPGCALGGSGEAAAAAASEAAGALGAPNAPDGVPAAPAGPGAPAIFPDVVVTVAVALALFLVLLVAHPHQAMEKCWLHPATPAMLLLLLWSAEELPDWVLLRPQGHASAAAAVAVASALAVAVAEIKAAAAAAAAAVAVASALAVAVAADQSVPVCMDLPSSYRKRL
eukprot:CAMPEP_0172778926 /NCGR_PEP_ID=MMETSP1074-20121228/202159_1 /TAXON_ID=2916 /ORGANISM="Ceratium fusus, Strain PA161109" /LENGTH=354 /DNA_ID=CAMNT_0013615879 /DNA_START=650 /DNA_END=1716 /DNA_ORIENTATION=+